MVESQSVTLSAIRWTDQVVLCNSRDMCCMCDWVEGWVMGHNTIGFRVVCSPRDMAKCNQVKSFVAGHNVVGFRANYVAVQWLVSTFHAFKAILTPMALDVKTRWVLPAYVKLFQNNMLVHLAQQSHSQVSPPSAPKSRVPPGPPSPPSVLRAEIATLRSELAALQAEFEEFKSSYESSSSRDSSSLPSPSEVHAASTVMPIHPPPPSSSSTMSIVQEKTSDRKSVV